VRPAIWLLGSGCAGGGFEEIAAAPPAPSSFLTSASRSCMVEQHFDSGTSRKSPVSLWRRSERTVDIATSGCGSRSPEPWTPSRPRSQQLSAIARMANAGTHHIVVVPRRRDGNASFARGSAFPSLPADPEVNRPQDFCRRVEDIVTGAKGSCRKG
jgi:hypothetical protein